MNTENALIRRDFVVGTAVSRHRALRGWKEVEVMVEPERAPMREEVRLTSYSHGGG